MIEWGYLSQRGRIETINPMLACTMRAEPNEVL